MRSFPTQFNFIILLIAAFGFVSESSSQTPDRPNIVLINLDDADSDILSDSMLESFYPNIRQMAASGLRFTNMHATTPFCAPSRAALFRGQYAFNTGVKVNSPDSSISNGFSGGHPEFVARGYHEDELGVWLKNAGYRTMHVGKFHHSDFDRQVPPGWDDFRASLGARYYGGTRFTNEIDPNGVTIQTEDDEYVTTIDGDNAVSLIQQHSTNSQQPFFLYVAPIAPHAPSTPDPEDMVEIQYANFAPNHSMPYTPDLFESDDSDKPRHLKQNLSASNIESIQRTHISRVRAIKSVDDMVGRIFAALEQTGNADSTYVFLTSDNGFQNGHHNLRGKVDPFHRTTNVPLLVTGPGINDNQSASHLLAHIDLCPTILNLAQTVIPDVVEARSFYPLLFSPNQFDEENWQEAIMIENWGNRKNFGNTILGAYAAYRTYDRIFVSWANGEHEYYNMSVDPYQLRNSYNLLSTVNRQNLKRKVRRFRDAEIEPITTIDQRFANRLQNRNVKLRGYAEDNSGVTGIQLIIRSGTTLRYWNGNSWQDQWFGHSVNPRNSNQPITVWNFNTQLETETPTGHDFLVFSYRSHDASDQFSTFVNSHVNEIDGKVPEADFIEYGEEIPTFGSNVTLNGTYFDAVEFDRASMTIRRVETGLYYDGQNFNEDRFEIPVELISGSEWELNLNLPQGFYVAGVKGFDSAGNRQHPAAIQRFRVQP